VRRGEIGVHLDHFFKLRDRAIVFASSVEVQRGRHIHKQRKRVSLDRQLGFPECFFVTSNIRQIDCVPMMGFRIVGTQRHGAHKLAFRAGKIPIIKEPKET
jgi:hypothetical protein